MLDFSFSEIALIGVVALVVIGPERLPRVARTAGVIFGRVNRYTQRVRADIAREVELSELREAQKKFEEAAKSVESSFHDVARETEQHLVETKDAVIAPPELTPPDLTKESRHP
jgi:sec-independent protein translocase protein TatB